MSLVLVADEPTPGALRLLVDRAARWQHLGVEVVMVCASRTLAESTVSAMSGGARLIYGPARASEQELRSIGVAAATGDIVVLVDDPRAADDRWIEHLSRTATAQSQVPPTELDPGSTRA